MKTLQAQRLKKQIEYDYQHNQETLELIWQQAEAEAEKLASLISPYEDINLQEEPKQVFEEYREDDDAVYFEEGFLER